MAETTKTAETTSADATTDTEVDTDTAGTEAHDEDALLSVRGLQRHFPVTRGIVVQHKVGAVKAVDGIDFSIKPGETLGLVGESGCGKSTTGRLVTRLDDPTGGTIRFDGKDITKLGRSELRPLRRDFQMIFQDPFSSLNPRQTVGSIVSAPFRIQGVESKSGTKKAVQDLMARVGLNPEHYNRYPHEFSGGQRQRIGIARALALRPKLIVCDEPVSALDVSIQAQVVNLLEDLQDEFKLAYLFVAHDLSIIKHISDRVAVMYLGKIVEVGDKDDIYTSARHPYTNALLSAVPEADPDEATSRERIRLTGDVPSPLNPPSGCRFRTRCWKAQDLCKTTEPPLVQLGKAGHLTACHFPVDPDDTARDSVVKEGHAEQAVAG